jgi:hypothetical protein
LFLYVNGYLLYESLGAICSQLRSHSVLSFGCKLLGM